MTRKQNILLFCVLAASIGWLPAQATTAQPEDKVLHWAGCGITKKAFMAELAAAYEKKTGIHVDLAGGGATRGIRETADLKVDMGGTCRMTLPELDNREMYVTLHPIAWDALTVIAHKANPVHNLTSDQIRAIYLGKITNWKQVGGADQPIHLYVRQGRISGVGKASVGSEIVIEIACVVYICFLLDLKF